MSKEILMRPCRGEECQYREEAACKAGQGRDCSAAHMFRLSSWARVGDSGMEASVGSCDTSDILSSQCRTVSYIQLVVSQCLSAVSAVVSVLVSANCGSARQVK